MNGSRAIPKFRHLIHKHVKLTDSVLELGCGNSRLSEELYKDGITEIICTDLSRVAVENMQKRLLAKGLKTLAEASVIVREHTPFSNLFMCLWFNEVVRFTSRDQLSFPYVFRRLKQLKINMFPVCTRKDLVNSMGHQRKVKPLIKPTPTNTFLSGAKFEDRSRVSVQLHWDETDS